MIILIKIKDQKIQAFIKCESQHEVTSNDEIKGMVLNLIKIANELKVEFVYRVDDRPNIMLIKFKIATSLNFNTPLKMYNFCADFLSKNIGVLVKYLDDSDGSVSRYIEHIKGFPTIEETKRLEAKKAKANENLIKIDDNHDDQDILQSSMPDKTKKKSSIDEKYWKKLDKEYESIMRGMLSSNKVTYYFRCHYLSPKIVEMGLSIANTLKNKAKFIKSTQKICIFKNLNYHDIIKEYNGKDIMCNLYHKPDVHHKKRVIFDTFLIYNVVLEPVTIYHTSKIIGKVKYKDHDLTEIASNVAQESIVGLPL